MLLAMTAIGLRDGNKLAMSMYLKRLDERSSELCSHRVSASLLLQCEGQRVLGGFALERLQLLLMLQLAPQGFLCCAKRTHLHSMSAMIKMPG